MELGNLRPFRHSGKFGAHAFVLVPLAGVLAGWPLGFAYGYLIKWIPFVYLNALITFCYALALGTLTGLVLKHCRVRNVTVAAVLATVVGVAANYFQWNGHLHALVDDMPLLVPPAMLREAMGFLFENGSWALRRGGNVTGWFLAGVWLVEAAAILAGTVLLGTGPIRETPYCEKSGCWLDEETKFDTLAAIIDTQELAQLRAGDVAPIIAGRAREAGAAAFTRLTLKHSPRCEEFFTLKAESVAMKTDSKGKVEEETTALTKDLVLPAAMRELVEQFANLKPGTAPALEGSAEAPAASG